MLYFLRHGETEWNNLHIVQGRVDIPLNEKGVEQARAAAEKLKDVKFDKIFCSPLSRVLETCEIATGVNRGFYILDERLLERDFGSLEGKEFISWERKDVDLWNLNDFALTKIKGLESLKSMKSRVFEFLDEIMPLCKDKNILITSHFGVAVLVEMYFKGEPKTNDLGEYRVHNAEVKCYEVK